MIYRTVTVSPKVFGSLVKAKAELSDNEISTEEKMTTTINHVYTEGGALPKGGVSGDILIKRSGDEYDAEWVAPATSPEGDNTRPITAGAVYTEIGNINALLAAI